LRWVVRSINASDRDRPSGADRRVVTAVAVGSLWAAGGVVTIVRAGSLKTAEGVVTMVSVVPVAQVIAEPFPSAPSAPESQAGLETELEALGHVGPKSARPRRGRIPFCGMPLPGRRTCPSTTRRRSIRQGSIARKSFVSEVFSW